MRLLMITQDFPPEYGGIQTYAFEHAARLQKKCDWFGVVCPNKQHAADTDRRVEFPVFRIKSRNELLGLNLLWTLPEVLKKYKVDAVFHTQWQTAGASLRAREKGDLEKIFIAAHIRELLFNPYQQIPLLGNWFQKYREKVLRNADHFYPVSDFTAGELQKQGVKEDRMTVIINGTNPDQFFPEEVSDLKKKLGLDRKKVLLTITRLVERKGIDSVITALPDIIREIPDLHYLVVGDGKDKKRLQRLIRDYGLNEHVTFAGKIPYDQLNRYYNLGDLFVMPSRTSVPDVEGFGIVFLEANACGLPVIGSDSGGIPSAIIQGKTGVIIPEEDQKVLAREVIRLFKDESLMNKMGRFGRKRVLESANWDHVSRQLFEDMNARFNYENR